MPRLCWAVYSDQILAPTDEVWDAGKEALKSFGIHKEKRDKGVMESDWIEEQIARSSGLFKGITSRIYVLRYRIRLSIREENSGMTAIDIKGDFQEKPLDARPPMGWRKARPDRDIEREFFHKILTHIETNRRR